MRIKALDAFVDQDDAVHNERIAEHDRDEFGDVAAQGDAQKSRTKTEVRQYPMPKADVCFSLPHVCQHGKAKDQRYDGGNYTHCPYI